MPLHLRNVRCRTGDVPVELDFSLLDGMIAGVTGPNGSGIETLLRLVAGELRPEAGVIEGFSQAALAAGSLASADAAEIRSSIDHILEKPVDVLLIGPCLALTDSEYQSRTLAKLHQRRREGAVVLLASHDLTLLERHCDEVLVMGTGRVAGRGDPRQVLDLYRARIIEALRQATPATAPQPVSRHGDERAVVRNVEIIREDGEPTAVVCSGEVVSAKVTVDFQGAVEKPVVGVLIRSRIGINVYGTNTEQEKIDIGPCATGDRIEVSFTFGCQLCPEQYTVTAATHDPDGTAHDWLEEAILFTVEDTRYTTGVANLRARVEVRRTRSESTV